MTDQAGREDVGPFVGEAAVKFVAGALLTSAGVDRWYDTPNSRLNNATPRQFVEAGDGKKVLDLLTRMTDGGFT